MMKFENMFRGINSAIRAVLKTKFKNFRFALVIFTFDHDEDEDNFLCCISLDPPDEVREVLRSAVAQMDSGGNTEGAMLH